MKVLIVEDEAIIQMELQSRVEALGHTVCGTATSGPQAIRACLALRPDLVLMDIKLQGSMDGIETARWIGAEVSTRVVFVSAYVDETMLERIVKCRPLGYLRKPFRESELQALLQAV